jgi:hypothetical protein
MAKSEVTSVRLPPKQSAWLAAREEETGLTPGETIKALIAAAMAGVGPSFVEPAAAPRLSAVEESALQRRHEMDQAEAKRKQEVAAKAAKAAKLRAQLAELEADDAPVYSDNPDDAPLVYEDDAPEGDSDPFDYAEAPRVATVSAMKAGAFSLTRPIGLRADLQGGSKMGERDANIIRNNFQFLNQPRRR